MRIKTSGININNRVKINPSSPNEIQIINVPAPVGQTVQETVIINLYDDGYF